MLVTVAALVGIFAARGAMASSNATPDLHRAISMSSVTTPQPSQSLTSVLPTEGAPGALIAVRGSDCISDAGHIEVFLAAAADPLTRLADGGAIASWSPPGDWSASLRIPDDAAPGADYEIGAQCWGDGTPFGHPGQQVEYFGYEPQPFTVTEPTATPQPSQPLTSVLPTEGVPGTVAAVRGSQCISDAGHIEVFLAKDADPLTRLAESDTGAVSNDPGDWSVNLHVPADAAPGNDYEIGAQCWGDGTPFGHPGQQVEYFGYEPQPFTVTEPAATTTTTTTTTLPSVSSSSTTVTTITLPTKISPRSGYWMLGADGRVYAFGDARRLGNAPGPSVAIATRSDGSGYWITDADGNVTALGRARGYGGRPALRPGEHVSTISATAAGTGYWLFTNLGHVFAYGDAHPYGDVSATHLNGRIVASVATPTGRGYYLVGSDGGVFSFGDARFRGSTGGLRLNQPVVGMSPTPDNRGYWLVAGDGGVFAFGAPFRGSLGSTRLNRPVDGLVAYGNGYLMGASDGGVFNFSNRSFLGSLADDPPPAPIIGIGAFAT